MKYSGTFRKIPMVLVCLVALTSTAFSATINGPIAKDGNGTARTGASLLAAVARLGNERGTVSLASGTWTITDNLTIPPTVNLQFQVGAVLAVAKGVRVTIMGPMQASRCQVFSGEGQIRFTDGAIEEIYPQWWGQNTSDDSVPINKAIHSAPDVGGVRVRLVGAFHCKTPILVDRDRVYLIGSGAHATDIYFNPTSDNVTLFYCALKGSNGASCLTEGSIRDLAIMCDPDSKVRKAAIQLVDTSKFELRNLSIMYCSGKDSSVGLKIQGRELGMIENVTITANLPISIEDNPYCSIDIDHFVFRNTYLVSMGTNNVPEALKGLGSTNPNVKIASGVNLTNVVFDGSNAWCGGKYGLYWNDTTSKMSGLNLSIKNVRNEQSPTDEGWIIYIRHNFLMQNLVIENVCGGGSINGLYLRNCTKATVENFSYSCLRPKAIALDVNESCPNLMLMNNYFWPRGVVVNTGKLVRVFATNYADHRNPDDRDRRQVHEARVFECWDEPDNRRGEGIEIYGTKTWCHSDKLAPGGSVKLPLNVHNKIATVSVAAATGPSEAQGGNFLVVKNNAPQKIAATGNVATTDTAGKLCLYPDGQIIVLKNNLGRPVDVVVTVFWN